MIPASSPCAIPSHLERGCGAAVVTCVMNKTLQKWWRMASTAWLCHLGSFTLEEVSCNVWGNWGLVPIATHIWSNDFWQGCQDCSMGEMAVFSVSGCWETWISKCKKKKMKLDPYLTPEKWNISWCISKQRMSRSSVIAALQREPWGNLGCENSGYWSQIAEVHIKRMSSVSPDSCIFPYIEKS